MTDKEKKPNILLWIMIGVGLLILVLGIGFYLLWKKISSAEIRSATVSKVVDDLRVSVAKVEADSKSKDEKYQEMTKEIGDMKTKNTELTYQLREMKKSGKATPQMRIGSGKKQQAKCDGDGCEMNTVEDLDD